MNQITKILLLTALLTVAYLALSKVIDTESDEQVQTMLRSRMLKQFENFKIKYNKQYDSEDEEQLRFSIFSKNYIQIIRHDKFLIFSKVAVNSFADLSEEEFKAMYTGHNGSEDDEIHGQLHATLPTHSLPSSFDWRDQGAITSVKSQSGCGGCWAFSTVASIESLYFLQTGNLQDLSTQQVIDCCRIDESGCVGGDPAPAFDCIQRFGGIELQTSYPYIAKQKSCSFNQSKVAFQISGFVDVPSDQLQVKAALLRQPLSICLNSSDVSFRFYTSGVITECEDGPYDSADHCLTMVGYGHDQQLGVDYWLIKNQWGTAWGENGYVRIIRDDNDHVGPGTCYVVSEVRYPLA